MTFLIADTFTDGLARLTGEEQKAVKTTSLDEVAPGGRWGGVRLAADPAVPSRRGTR